MNLEEFYEFCGGSYTTAKSRLQSDALIQRFVLKFLSDGSYNALCEAVQAGDNQAAFMAAHTLKGVCQNLSFDRLAASAGALTELLRHWETEPVDPAVCQTMLEDVIADYNVVANALEQLKAAQG